MQRSLFYKGLALIRQKIIIIKYKNFYLNNKNNTFAKNGIILKTIFILSNRSGLPIGNLM